MSAVQRRAPSPVSCSVCRFQLATTSGLCFLKNLSCTFFDRMWDNPVAGVGQPGKVEQAMFGPPLGHLCAEYELDTASSIRSLTLSPIAPSPKGFVHKITEEINTTWSGRIHVLKKFNVIMGCTVTNQLTWPSTMKSDGTKEFATTDSMDGCNVLPETGGGVLERGQSLTSNRL